MSISSDWVLVDYTPLVETSFAQKTVTVTKEVIKTTTALGTGIIAAGATGIATLPTVSLAAVSAQTITAGSSNAIIASAMTSTQASVLSVIGTTLFPITLAASVYLVASTGTYTTKKTYNILTALIG